MKKLIPLVSMSLLLWLAPAVAAQETPKLLARIEKAVAEQEPRWKVAQWAPNSIRLKSGGADAVVWVHVGESAKSAGEAFEGNTISFGSRTGRRGKKETLPDFADENVMWRGLAPGGTTSIHFRQGNVYVNLIAPTRATAERLARLALGQVVEYQKSAAGRAGGRP
jgi:hypothetical protein